MTSRLPPSYRSPFNIRTIMRLSLYCRVCLLCSAHVDSQLMLATDISDHHATRISVYLLNKLPLNIERFYESIGFRVIARLSQTLQNLFFAPGERPDGLYFHLRHDNNRLAPSLTSRRSASGCPR